MDESGCDGCVGVSSSPALGEDDTLADPDPDADRDPDTDADPDPGDVVPEGRLDGSGGRTLGDGLAGALRLGVGTGTGRGDWVFPGDGELE